MKVHYDAKGSQAERVLLPVLKRLELTDKEMEVRT